MFSFLIRTMLISLSGVLAPGPVTAVTVGQGNRSPYAGAWVALGHGAIEIPLMVILLLGFGTILQITLVDGIIGLLGGVFLLYMSVGMIRDMKKADVESVKDTHKPFVSGMLLSIMNPYFLLWWAMVGVTLIEESQVFGIMGFVLFAVVHWLCDFVWLFFLSALAFGGKKFYGGKFQQRIFAICALVLLFFSGKFIIGSVRILFL